VPASFLMKKVHVMVYFIVTNEHEINAFMYVPIYITRESEVQNYLTPRINPIKF